MHRNSVLPTVGRTVAATVLAAVLLSRPAGAQGGGSAPHAMFTRYAARAGMEREFEAGYVRHLRWHLDARDPWAWYMWRVDTGERQGEWVGGSFGHAWAGNDARPRPAEDGADHRRNVDGYRDGGYSSHLAQRPDLGGALPLLETAPLLFLFEMEVRPEAAGEFEAALRDAAAAGARGAHGWFEVVNGGRQPRYLLAVPGRSVSELARLRWGRMGVPEGGDGEPRVARALERARGTVSAVRSEMLEFLPGVSTCVRAESRCVGTVPPAP